jgi:hypothetical protein
MNKIVSSILLLASLVAGASAPEENFICRGPTGETDVVVADEGGQAAYGFGNNVYEVAISQKFNDATGVTIVGGALNSGQSRGMTSVRIRANRMTKTGKLTATFRSHRFLFGDRSRTAIELVCEC